MSVPMPAEDEDGVRLAALNRALTFALTSALKAGLAIDVAALFDLPSPHSAATAADVSNMLRQVISHVKV